MSNYEWVATVVSILSLVATIFFGMQVYKLTKQANKIAKESVNIQKQQIEMAVNKKVDEHYFNNKFKSQKDEIFSELEKNAESSFSSYNDILNQSKYNNEENKQQINELTEEVSREFGKKHS